MGRVLFVTRLERPRFDVAPTPTAHVLDLVPGAVVKTLLAGLTLRGEFLFGRHQTPCEPDFLDYNVIPRSAESLCERERESSL
jgi:hypothetical protein